MTDQTKTDFFTEELAERYDERNRSLSPISDNMHFLMSLVLERLPEFARILCVGAGTGAEILYLAQRYPRWSFVAVEPSLSMLKVCKRRIENASLFDRCEFFHGFAHQFESDQKFDAVLSVLVGHFVKRSERASFYQSLASHLGRGGYLVNTEISADFDSEEFSSLQRNWESIQRLMGASQASLAQLPVQLREVLTVITPSEVEQLMHEAGVEKPIQFFKAFLISGWYARKALP